MNHYHPLFNPIIDRYTQDDPRYKKYKKEENTERWVPWSESEIKILSTYWDLPRKNVIEKVRSVRTDIRRTDSSIAQAHYKYLKSNNLKLSKGHGGSLAIPVRCLKTGKEYPSFMKAFMDHGMRYSDEERLKIKKGISKLFVIIE